MTVLKLTAGIKIGSVIILTDLQANCCEQNAGVAPNQPAVRLQFVGEPESKSPDASQYAAIYQALDPTSLDWALFILSWQLLLPSSL